MAVNIKFPAAAGAVAKGVQLYNYRYDQLNRLTAMDVYRGFNSATNQWNNPITATPDYKERISYDANGNIHSCKRNGSTVAGRPLEIDNLTYQYAKDINGNKLNNRLRYVHDNANAANYSEDIDSQVLLTMTQAEVLTKKKPEQSTDNYQYDAIGNLIKRLSQKMFVTQRALSKHKGHKELTTYCQPFVFVVFLVVYFVLPKLLLLRQPHIANSQSKPCGRYYLQAKSYFCQ